jgi:hypothetical protein
MQGADRAAWPFPASDRQHGSALVGAARLFNFLFLSSLTPQFTQQFPRLRFAAEGLSRTDRKSVV